MKESNEIVTVVIGKRSNLSVELHKRLKNVDLLSSNSLLESMAQLEKYREKKVNVVFNNFQSSSQLKSYIKPSSYIDVSISITVEILMYLINNNVIIQKIIYTSSSSVYGDSLAADEDSQPHPDNIPSTLKYLNEQFLTQICSQHDLNLTIARVFNMYGGNDHFSIIQKIHNCYVNNEILTVLNNGSSVRDFIHVKNVVDIYEKLLLNPSIKINILNVGSGIGRSISQIIRKLSEKGHYIDVCNGGAYKEIPFSKANVSKLQGIVDTTSFVVVDEYLVRKNMDFM
jgi:UDP-glucose 4-epimerase